MNILVIGNEVNRVETAQKFGVQHMYDFAESISEAKPGLRWAGVIFDFVSAATPDALIAYEQISVPVFLDTTFTSLSAIVKAAGLRKMLFGFCGLPTFVNRELLEVCIANTSDEIVLKEWSVAVDTKYSLVKDQVGFITPRIICMIINEAYFTVEEGTATREDIDLAMKLGTNYPFGPFEWAAKIGMQNVVRILDTAHRSSGDERYQACNLLRAEATV
ncbi:MAG: 3-hydroxyacyl-CoA dehydrogenase [Cyclobacteriaceae bacterium]|nr:MAG: 3-hydroxyacyl-CoA dehydrogenase [Cyclobacteriaceae bacterium]